MVDRHCEVCGESFSIANHRAKLPGYGRFCSKRCRGKWQFEAGVFRPRPGGPDHPLYKHGRRAVPVANQILNNAIQAGTVQRQPCAKCGNTKSEGHHDDYSKPLEVTWLCRPCHRRVDAELRRARGVERLSPLPDVAKRRIIKWPAVMEVARELGPGATPQAIRRRLAERGIRITWRGVAYALRTRGSAA